MRCKKKTSDYYEWSLTPCSAETEIDGILCRRCDYRLNKLLLNLFDVEDRDSLLEQYWKRS